MWAVDVHSRSTASDVGTGADFSEYVSRYRVEVLATNGPAPTRVSLAFEQNIQRHRGIDRPTSVHGKTYIVDVAPPHVRRVTGVVPAEEEAQRVLDVLPDLGTRTQIDQVLPETSMAIGDERNELAAAILRIIHPRAWTLEKGSAELTETDDDDALFSITIEATSMSGFRMNVRGEARIRMRETRLVSVELDGGFELKDGGDSGTFSYEWHLREE